MAKKILSVIAIVAGGLTLFSVAAPMIMGMILKLQMKTQLAGSVGIIGGADGPTSIMVVGALGVGSAIFELVIGILLMGVGIWGLRKSRR